MEVGGLFEGLSALPPPTPPKWVVGGILQHHSTEGLVCPMIDLGDVENTISAPAGS